MQNMGRRGESVEVDMERHWKLLKRQEVGAAKRRHYYEAIKNPTDYSHWIELLVHTVCGQTPTMAVLPPSDPIYITIFIHSSIFINTCFKPGMHIVSILMNYGKEPKIHSVYVEA